MTKYYFLNSQDCKLGSMIKTWKKELGASSISKARSTSSVSILPPPLPGPRLHVRRVSNPITTHPARAFSHSYQVIWEMRGVLISTSSRMLKASEPQFFKSSFSSFVALSFRSIPVNFRQQKYGRWNPVAENYYGLHWLEFLLKVYF